MTEKINKIKTNPEVVLISVPAILDSNFTNDCEWIKKNDQLLGKSTDQIVEFAGRECYDSLGSGRSSEKYHEHIKEVGHKSVLEHVKFVFRLSGVSRAFSHEWVRHRHASISQRSTRYCDESDSYYVLPPLFRSQKTDNEETLQLKEEAYKIFEKARKQDLEQYDELLLLGEKILKENKNIDKISRRKICRGAARGVLANNLETSLIWSANLSSIRNILFLRASKYAEWEIREVAYLMYEEIKKHCTYLLNDLEETICEDGYKMELKTKYKV